MLENSPRQPDVARDYPGGLPPARGPTEGPQVRALAATTAVRNIAPMLLMMIYPFAADPLVTVSITILNTVGIVIVLLFVLMWRRAASPSDTHATTSQPA